jgi:uncharacterized membrane protein YdfJ with MMPL/SSD domain
MRRPWRAIALWLVFVAAAGAIGFATGIKSLQNGAVGESARGYELIDEHQAYGPSREYGYVGTIAVILCAVAGSVTVLPAVLELLGPRIDRGRIPFLPHLHTDASKSRFWPAVIDRVLRRPAHSAALSAGLLVALAVPALDLHFSKPE